MDCNTATCNRMLSFPDFGWQFLLFFLMWLTVVFLNKLTIYWNCWHLYWKATCSDCSVQIGLSWSKWSWSFGQNRFQQQYWAPSRFATPGIRVRNMEPAWEKVCKSKFRLTSRQHKGMTVPLCTLKDFWNAVVRHYEYCMNINTALG